MLTRNSKMTGRIRVYLTLILEPHLGGVSYVIFVVGELKRERERVRPGFTEHDVIVYQINVKMFQRGADTHLLLYVDNL